MVNNLMKKFITFICYLMLCRSVQAENLRVITENLPPYQIVVNDKLVGGSSVLLVKEILKRANINADIEVLPWARAYRIASHNSNTLIFSMARNKTRESQFIWLVKLKNLTYHFYSLTSRPHLKAKNITEMLKHTVVTVRNSYEANSLKNFGFSEDKNLILTNTYSTAWKMLSIGRADYTYANELITETLNQKITSSTQLYKQAFDLGDTSDLYIAANVHMSSELLTKIKHSIETMRADGTLKNY